LALLWRNTLPLLRPTSYELSGEVADDCIATILSETTDAQTRVDRLIAAALEAGGKDNVTVIVINSVVI
jgi:PPM family protein phosphatase